MTGSHWTRRQVLRRTAYAVGAAAIGTAGATTVGGCTKLGVVRTVESLRSEGSVRVGVAGERPYGFTLKGTVTGQAPELARAIFVEMGVEDLDATEVPFSSLIPSLETEIFDVICAGMAVLPERCDQVLFTDPDYCAQTAFLIRDGSAADGITNFDDVAGNPDIKIATLGTGAVEYGTAIAAGVQRDQITPIAGQADAFAALEDGRIDALTLTRAALTVLLEDNPDAPITISEGFFPVVDGEEVKSCGGFGFRPADHELRDAFNDVLHRFQDEGRVIEIVKDFGLTEEEVEAASEETRESLCGESA